MLRTVGSLRSWNKQAGATVTAWMMGTTAGARSLACLYLRLCYGRTMRAEAKVGMKVDVKVMPGHRYSMKCILCLEQQCASIARNMHPQ
jgi:hypothetical protein